VSSRYYSAVIDYITLYDGGDVKPIVFYEFDQISNKSYSVHVCVYGDRLDQLSYKYFNRPDMWWAIIEYNPEIRDFFNLLPGTYLRIPNV
jgi:hypothetical protein